MVVVREGIFKKDYSLMAGKKKSGVGLTVNQFWKCFVHHYGVKVYEYFHSSVLKVVTWICFQYVEVR